jgi:hypothetical protein
MRGGDLMGFLLKYIKVPGRNAKTLGRLVLLISGWIM